MCDNNDSNEYIVLALNVPSKPNIITNKNAKSFKRKARKSEKAIQKIDFESLQFDKYMEEKR